MKTRKQHLQKLPLQKRLQAMENIRRHNILGLSALDNAPYIESVLRGAFTYNDTKQGHSYWRSIQEKYFSE